MPCLECQRELTGPGAGGYANAADWAVLQHTGCCSARCAILQLLSQIFALDKSALLPHLLQYDEEPTKVMFRLEDLLKHLQAPPPAAPEA